MCRSSLYEVGAFERMSWPFSGPFSSRSPPKTGVTRGLPRCTARAMPTGDPSGLCAAVDRFGGNTMLPGGHARLNLPGRGDWAGSLCALMTMRLLAEVPQPFGLV